MYTGQTEQPCCLCVNPETAMRLDLPPRAVQLLANSEPIAWRDIEGEVSIHFCASDWETVRDLVLDTEMSPLPRCNVTRASFVLAEDFEALLNDVRDEPDQTPLEQEMHEGAIRAIRSHADDPHVSDRDLAEAWIVLDAFGRLDVEETMAADSTKSYLRIYICLTKGLCCLSETVTQPSEQDMSGNTPTVLVVDDEPAIVDGHAARLEADYVVRTAYDGNEALDLLDEEVDVVLLDRRMPGLGGEEVLDHVHEAGFDCRVAMLTGIEPGLDILDLGFDDYVTKPVSKDELFEVVERMLRRARYDRGLREFFALASKAAALETKHDPEVLAANPEYQTLRTDMETLRDELDDALEQLPKQERYTIATRTDPGSDRASN